MLLSEVLSYVATLDSSAIDLDTDEDGVVTAANRPKVINALNLALLSLYTEFPIKEKMLVVQLWAHITDYYLTRDYASTNTASTQPYKYIMDTTFDPFYEDLIKILMVSNEGGQELFLNTNNQAYSVYTPQYNMIQHPYPDDDNAIFVTYKARHAAIATTADPAVYEVEFPEHLLDVLLVYIDHKLLAGINKDDSLAKLTEYHQLVAGKRTLGLFNFEGSSNEKIDRNGWE